MPTEIGPKPNPWPCVTTLGRDGVLAWMAHIEITPYAMKPATRAVFDAARTSLQKNPVPIAIVSSEQERVLDRIIRACWERGWRPDERGAA